MSPARKQWFNHRLPRPARSLETARKLLPSGKPATFTLVVNSGNPAYTQTAAILEEDLKPLGITVRVVPLEFRSLVDRVLNRRDFDAAIMAMRPGDADPAADTNVLVSSGRTRLWNMTGRALRPWESEVDTLMRSQLTTRDLDQRIALFHRVQQILATELPIICLASPNLLYAARNGLSNLRPSPIGEMILWNADELFWAQRPK